MHPTIVRRMTGTAAALVATLALCLGLAGCGSSATDTKTISVSASHTVLVTPDVARITVTITTEGADPSAAQKANGKPTRAVIAKLKELGVPDEQIQTTYTDLSPVWNEDGMSDTYEMRTVLSVGGLAIPDVSGIMDACVDEGATEVNGPEYYVSSFDEAYSEALKGAIEACRPKAEAMAAASGVTLGKVLSVSEGYEDRSYAMPMSDAVSEEMAFDAGGTAELEPGQVSIEAQVSVTYAIN